MLAVCARLAGLRACTRFEACSRLVATGNTNRFMVVPNRGVKSKVPADSCKCNNVKGLGTYLIILVTFKVADFLVSRFK